MFEVEKMKSEREIKDRLQHLMAVEGILQEGSKQYIKALKWVLE